MAPLFWGGRAPSVISLLVLPPELDIEKEPNLRVKAVAVAAVV